MDTNGTAAVTPEAKTVANPKKLVQKAPAKKASNKKMAKGDNPKKGTSRKETAVRKLKLNRVPRKPGPAMIALKGKLKPEPVKGECAWKGCSKKAVTKLARWCMGHKKAIRKAQLKANNKVWNRRVKDGSAGHHVVYDGAATVWAVMHKDKAIQQVKKGHSIISTVKDFQTALQKVPTEIKKAVRGA